MQTLDRPTYPSILQNTVVVFSKNYLPVSRVSIRRAICLLVTGQAEPVDVGDCQIWEVRSPNLILQVPEHIRLTFGNPARHWKVPPVNRRGVLQRDNHLCQYCGSRKKLTLDHVLPRSKGGQHTWDNVVAACSGCNGKKGDKLLLETNMTLRQRPKAPIHPAVVFADHFWKSQSVNSTGSSAGSE
jgi:5-methylcytosine-specific restriction endonuclease McrA